jgi:phosphatidyl-myo-inositol dimannoside synthase
MIDAMRPRILVVTRNLPPLVGGMERLNWHMVAELAKYADVEVIGPVGAAAIGPAGALISEVPLTPLKSFLLGATITAVKRARRFRPHVVLAGSGLTAPIALLASHVANATSVAYVHGLDLTTQHPLYRRLWIPALRRMRCIIANSGATASLATRVGIESARVQILHPGVTLPEITSDDEVARFRRKYNLGKSALLLSVGRLSRRKGLLEFVQQALPKIVAKRTDVLLLIVGDTPHDALNAQSQTPESIRLAATQAGVGSHVVFLGKVSDQELASAFRASDVHVFPIRDIPNDPEGFGMVAVEAAAHGVPTVAFASGGVVDAVCEGRSGYLVSPGDYAAFAQRVLDALDGCSSRPDSCREFAQQFTWTNFGQSLWRYIVGAAKTLDDVDGVRHAAE